MVITSKQGVKLLITRGCLGLLKIKVSLAGQQLEQTSYNVSQHLSTPTSSSITIIHLKATSPTSNNSFEGNQPRPCRLCSKLGLLSPIKLSGK